MDEDVPPRRRGSARLRIFGAFAVALAFSLAVYLLLEAVRPDTGLVSFSFLLVLPAALSAFVCYVADPWAERSRGFYLRVPLWLLLAVIVLSVIFLKEGVICVVILSPLWMTSGVVGAAITYQMRRRRAGTDMVSCSAILLVPLLALQIEPAVPLPEGSATVTRSIVVNAAPEAIWPLLRGIPDVRQGEGRWNFTQDILGVPRPLGARLVGEGIGARRLANWGRDIRFTERITDWRPGSRIGWRFIFDRIDGWKFTDRHLMPNSPYFGVTSGGYRLVPIAGGRTQVILDTRYRIRTPVNGYSKLWGEVFLGDLENNLLALIQQRAEAASGGPRPI